MGARTKPAQDRNLVIGGTVLGGIIIAGAAAYAGLSGSM